MIIVETFKNPLDGKTLKRLHSDKNVYLLEKATKAEYAEAVIPESRSEKEFEETDREIEPIIDEVLTKEE